MHLSYHFKSAFMMSAVIASNLGVLSRRQRYSNKAESDGNTTMFLLRTLRRWQALFSTR